ncbi:MAG TPA: cysteine synthase family protein [Roseiflexaceae bacterium]|nr:cysteine synthase family protein [Roseiflexaceae bacterium]
MIRDSIIDTVGRTPLVRLRPVGPSAAPVYAKLELLNPFGMKDRAAKQIILEARRSGRLAEGDCIVESSSGTMALGVALVGTYLGHRVHIITDPRIDPITLAKLEAIGCTVQVVERMGEQGWQGARLALLRDFLEANPRAFWPRQYDNPDNPRAYAELAAELVDDLGGVDVLVGSVGSGGSLCGTARELRRRNPYLRVVGVDAVGSVIFGQPDRPGRRQGGLGNSLVPPNVDHSVIDEVHWLNDSEAFAATLELMRAEKIFAGNSSGSVYQVARWLARQEPLGSRIVAIMPDRGDRYFSTIYSAEYRRRNGLLDEDLPVAPVELPPGAPATRWSYSRLHDQTGSAAGVRELCLPR